MMRDARRELILLALVLGACAERAPAPAAEPAYRIIDVMPRYWAFRDSTRGTPVDSQVGVFKRMVIGSEPRFFDQVVGPKSDDRIGNYLTQIAKYDSVMQRMGGEFVAAIPPSMRRLGDLFADFDPSVPIYVTPSLFNSNGQVRYLDDSIVVMLGPDVHAYVEVEIDSGRGMPPGVLIEHELTHYHHWHRNPEVAEAARSFFQPGSYSQLYYNLWSEGVATWVARRLNPDLEITRVLGPGVVPARDSALIPRIAGEFLAKLDSRTEDDVRDLFYLSGRRVDIPTRSAYYIGYLVVDHVARGRSVDEVIKLKGPELREAIRQALEDIRQ